MYNPYYSNTVPCAGKRCEYDIDECGSNPCQHGGQCLDRLNGYTCQCLPGYTGTNCETNMDDCAVNPCRNGGACIDLVNAYKCVCDLPYTGHNCQDKLDPCTPNRCVHVKPTSTSTCVAYVASKHVLTVMWVSSAFTILQINLWPVTCLHTLVWLLTNELWEWLF